MIWLEMSYARYNQSWLDTEPEVWEDAFNGYNVCEELMED